MRFFCLNLHDCMDMKKAAFIIIPLLTVFLCACSDDSDDILSRQQTSMTSYLTSTHSPKLIAEEDLDSSLEREPQYYSTFGQTAYRYISTLYDEGRDDRPEIEWGDIVEIHYTAYVFEFRNVTAENIYATNELASLIELEEAGLNTSYEWTTDPLTIELGQTDIIKGIESSLVGCREGDDVEVYMTFSMAYDDMAIGAVPYQSPVAWHFTIDTVTKRN